MTQHTCPCLLVHCIDFRFQQAIENLLKTLDFECGDFDRVAVAGGAGNFEVLKHHAPLSKKLHCPNVAILTVHEDCGAGAKKDDLIKAREIAKDLFEKVRCFYLKLDGTFEEVL